MPNLVIAKRRLIIIKPCWTTIPLPISTFSHLLQLLYHLSAYDVTHLTVFEASYPVRPTTIIITTTIIIIIIITTTRPIMEVKQSQCASLAHVCIIISPPVEHPSLGDREEAQSAINARLFSSPHPP